MNKRFRTALIYSAALPLVGVFAAPAFATVPSCSQFDSDSLSTQTGVFTCVVAPDVVSLDAIVTGAGGAGGGGVRNSFGGAGALVTTTIPVTPGETLTVEVGSGGHEPTSSSLAQGGGGGGDEKASRAGEDVGDGGRAAVGSFRRSIAEVQFVAHVASAGGAEAEGGGGAAAHGRAGQLGKHEGRVDLPCELDGNRGVGAIGDIHGRLDLFEQLLANGAAIVWSFALTFGIMMALKVTIGVRANAEDESNGLDLALHGERVDGQFLWR